MWQGATEKEMMLLCWPACALALLICFSCGCYLGRVWQRSLAHKESQRQNESKEKVEDEIATEVVKKGLKHKGIYLDAKEMTRRYDREGGIQVYFSQSGTKVHFVKECQGLNSADFTRIQTRTICKHIRLSCRTLVPAGWLPPCHTSRT